MVKVKELLEQKIEENHRKEEEKREAARVKAAKNAILLKEACDKVEDMLEGMNYVRDGANFTLNYSNGFNQYKIYIKVEWTLEDCCYDDYDTTKEWLLGASIYTNRSQRNPEVRCSIDSVPQMLVELLL